MLQEKTVSSSSPRPAQSNASELDLMALAGTLWRGKFTILVCMIAAILVGGFYSFFVASPRYTASASLIVESQAPALVDIESVVSGVSTEDSAMNTEVLVINSRGILETLVEVLSLTEDPEFNRYLRPVSPLEIAADKVRGLLGRPSIDDPTEAEILFATVQSVRNAINASVQRNTYSFNIRVTTGSRNKSQLIANTLANIYIEDQIAQKFAATETAVTWLAERVAELETQLLQREEQLASFRSSIDVVSLEAVEALNRQLATARDQLASARADIAAYDAQTAEIDVLRSTGNLGAIAELLDDASLRRLAEAGEGIDSPAVVARLDALTARASQERDRRSQQAQTLQNSVERIEERVADQSAELGELQQYERELLATRTLYETFLNRLKEATVQLGLQQADSRVLSAANPGNRVAPRRGTILLMSAFLGILIGAAWVAFRQFQNRGYRTAVELETDTGQTTLGQIPLMPIKRRDQLISYLNDKPASAAAEAIRNLRTSILLATPDHPPQIIMSTSALPGEGKTTQSISLAHNLTIMGRRVLLIEGDVRRRTLDLYFKNLDAGGGIVKAMERQGGDISDLLVRDSRINMDVILGEESSLNAADLFSSEMFRTFLDKLRTEYDHIIIDTPPVLVVPDARVIGQHVDTIVFNVNWNKTSKVQVREALRQLATVNLEPSGLVLTKININDMRRYGYGGKYGAYGSYGSSYYEA